MEKRPWWRGHKGEWYVVVQFALLGWLVIGPQNVPGMAPWGEPWSVVAQVVGGVLLLAGLAMALWGVQSLGQNLTAVPHPKEDAHLVETGAYRVVRHPIYSGIVLGSVGFALFVNGGLTLLYALVIFLFFDAKSRREERWLAERYTDYTAYQQRVHKLIPYVY